MKFKRYITESDGTHKNVTKNLNEIKEILNRECSTIIKAYKKSNSFLFRGSRYPADEDTLVKVTSRLKDRMPSSTPRHIHKYFNMKLKEKFGWPVRNGVFVVGSKGFSEIFGNPYIFFPVNGFKFCWSRLLDDLYGTVVYPYVPDRTLSSEEKDAAIKKDFEENILNTYTDKNLVNAINSRAEISFNVKYYYILDYYDFKKHMKYILGL